MFPGTALNHLSDGLFTNAKALRKRALSSRSLSPTLANDANSIVVQFGVSVRRAVGNQLRMLSAVVNVSRRDALLGSHISEVVEVCAEEQMLRTHTGRIVTVVTDLKSVRDRAIGQFIRETMGSNRTVTSLSPDREASISLAVRTSSPDPALARLVNSAPETFGERNVWITESPMVMATKVNVPVVTVVLADTDGESASAGAKGDIGDRMILHDGYLRCATPGAVASSARASLCPLYHAN